MDAKKIEEKNSGEKTALTVVIVIRKNMDFQRIKLLRKKVRGDLRQNFEK